MLSLEAILVEDDADQAARTVDELVQLGFVVKHFFTATDFAAAVAAGDVTSETDLFVLDRKLPQTLGAEPDNSVGDELLEAVISTFPDSLITVLSGYSDRDHLREALRGRGQIHAHGPRQFDRVEVFQKSDLPDAVAYFRSIRDWAQEVENVELVTVDLLRPLSKGERRLLKKLVLAMNCVKGSARGMAGGLTGDVVLEFSAENTRGISTAHVVAKLTRRSVAQMPSGVIATAPRINVAPRTGTLSGLCGGLRVNTYQIAAGTTVTSLMELSARGDSSAVDALDLLLEALGTDATINIDRVSFKDLIEPLLDWDWAQLLSVRNTIPLPDQGTWIARHLALQHGDLHAGNVLVVDAVPVLIDADDEVLASWLLDPVLLLLGTFVHPDSAVRDVGVLPADVIALLSGEVSQVDSPWITSTAGWVRSRAIEPRELWAVVYAVCLRYLSLDSIQSHQPSKDLVEALARHAAASI